MDLLPIFCKLGLKNDVFDISKFCLPIIIWTFFQTSDDISIYKKCYLLNALRPRSFSYLGLGWESQTNLAETQFTLNFRKRISFEDFIKTQKGEQKKSRAQNNNFKFSRSSFTFNFVLIYLIDCIHTNGMCSFSHSSK